MKPNWTVAEVLLYEGNESEKSNRGGHYGESGDSKSKIKYDEKVSESLIPQIL